MNTTALWVTIILISLGVLLLSFITRSARQSRRRDGHFRHRPFMENGIEATEGFQRSEPHTTGHHHHHHHHHHSNNPSGGSTGGGHHHSGGGLMGGGHHSGGSWGGGMSGGHGGFGGHH